MEMQVYLVCNLSRKVIENRWEKSYLGVDPYPWITSPNLKMPMREFLYQPLEQSVL